MEHSFSGIGIRLTQQGPRFVIAFVIPDGPAARSGLKEGDEIIGVGGRSLAGRNLREIVESIRGTQGTRVRLTIANPQRRSKLFTIERSPLRFLHERKSIEALPAPKTGSCVSNRWVSCSCPDGCGQGYCDRLCSFLTQSGGQCFYSCPSCSCEACA
ncbi:S41 family peptidase [Bradyrhizobium sp. SZCCHNPS1003]|uniref:S41 family peptidase n=1 Tax=Bradyrhizobium sp. SZCCHNPS1003 TaxID=3057330 RepID=UPI00396588B3